MKWGGDNMYLQLQLSPVSWPGFDACWPVPGVSSFPSPGKRLKFAVSLPLSRGGQETWVVFLLELAVDLTHASVWWAEMEEEKIGVSVCWEQKPSVFQQQRAFRWPQLSFGNSPWNCVCAPQQRHREPKNYAVGQCSPSVRLSALETFNNVNFSL